MRHSSIRASTIARITASGTAMAENFSVLRAAIRKAELANRRVKFSRNTKRLEATPSIIE